MESEEVVRKALKDIIHLALNVKGDGAELGGLYHAGPYYPLFVLTNNFGKEIFRWTGYTTSSKFIGSLKAGLSDFTTVEERIERNYYNPNKRDINFLAKYFSDRREYQKSNRYYRMAQNLGGRFPKDYSYLIFQNYADAIWNDILPFDSIFTPADDVIISKRVLKENIRKMAMMMSNLARKYNRTSDIGKYLQAGIDATAGTQNETIIKHHHLIKADYDLYITNDTIGALNNQHKSMGVGWENDVSKYYIYGKWYFDRKFNLDEAEKYMRIACRKATAGAFRAKHLSLLAEICYARGKKGEAIRQMTRAINNDPENESFQKRLKQLKQ